mgnify:CR=1 FL=1
MSRIFLSNKIVSKLTIDSFNALTDTFSEFDLRAIVRWQVIILGPHNALKVVTTIAITTFENSGTVTIILTVSLINIALVQIRAAGLGTCMALPNVGYNPAQFALHYMFEKEEILNEFLKNIKSKTHVRRSFLFLF